jgi:cytidylate kinase
MALITMSREIEALGDEIAQELEKKIKYRFVNKEMIEAKLEEFGISQVKREKYDEKKPSFWASLSQEKDDYLHFLKTVMYEFAKEGDCTMVGRGSSALFGGIAGCLHVRVVAPYPVRVMRIGETYKCDDRRAKQIIEQSDHDRIGFHRYFFNMDCRDPANYEMVLNTGSLDPSVAANVIIALKKALISPEAEAAGLSAVADRLLGQRVVTAIIYEKKISVHFLEASCQDGAVSLHGVTNYQPAIEAAVAAAQTVAGVKSVKSEIQVVQEYSVLP